MRHNKRTSGDELAIDGHLPVRRSLMELGWLQRVDARCRRIQSRSNAAEHLCHALVENLSGVFEARRAVEIPRLERATHRMNVMLGLLAAVLALETIVEYRVTGTAAWITQALRIGVVVTVLVVVVVLARGWLADRRSRQKADRAQALYEDIVRTLVEMSGLPEEGLSTEQARQMDDRLRRRLAMVIDELADRGSATGLLPAERWALRALLAGGRTSEFYAAGPLPGVAVLFSVRGWLSGFEFERTLERSGCYETDRVRR